MGHPHQFTPLFYFVSGLLFQNSAVEPRVWLVIKNPKRAPNSTFALLPAVEMLEEASIRVVMHADDDGYWCKYAEKIHLLLDHHDFYLLCIGRCIPF